MTEDEVMLAAAIMLLKRYGDEAPVKVAERIGELAVIGDHLGVALWKAIAGRMNEILHAGPMQ